MTSAVCRQPQLLISFKKYHIVLRVGDQTSIWPAQTWRYVSWATVAYSSPPTADRSAAVVASKLSQSVFTDAYDWKAVLSIAVGTTVVELTGSARRQKGGITSPNQLMPRISSTAMVTTRDAPAAPTAGRSYVTAATSVAPPGAGAPACAPLTRHLLGAGSPYAPLSQQLGLANWSQPGTA